jgi:hypothetical protein
MQTLAYFFFLLIILVVVLNKLIMMVNIKRNSVWGRIFYIFIYIIGIIAVMVIAWDLSTILYELLHPSPYFPRLSP